MKKSIISLLVAALILVATMLPAFAVTDINEYEKQVLDMINKGITISGKTLDLSRYYNQAYNYFLANDKLDSQDKVDEIIAAKDKLASTLTDAGVTVESDGKHMNNDAVADKNKLVADCLAILNGVAGKYDITVTYNSVTDVVTLKGEDVNFSTDDLIRQTGAESVVVPVFMGAALVVALVGTSLFVFKKTKKAEV